MRTYCAAALLLLPAVGPGLAAQQKPDPALLAAAAGYAAKIAASALFVSGRTLQSVLDEELAADRPLEALIRPLLQFDVDEEARSVTCRLGAAKATAIGTRGLGCVLLQDDTAPHHLRSRGSATAADLPDAATLDWPLGDRLPTTPPTDIDLAALQRAIDGAFAEQEGKPLVRTRAVVVLHRGQLVAERYAPGYDASMRLPGWSMTKTLVNALVGVRVHQDALDLAAKLDVPEWSRAEDPRHGITLPHLLSMTGGLRWNESYDDPASDVLRMLFASADHAAVYAGQEPITAPGTGFRYSSGCTNLVCRLLRRTFADDDSYWDFPRDALFEPLGMRSAMIETDASGTFVGSSYGFATARDWARFCLLLANDGMVGDRRLLPEHWVRRSATAVPASNGRFGWHLWLNADPDDDGPRSRPWPGLPEDLMRADGHEGQYCTLLPTQQLVVVRLGCTKNGGFDLRALLRGAIAACR